MAVNVLVIPEDFRQDQYILKPIISALFEHIGVRARVRVCQDPLLGGVEEALKWERQKEIIDRYRGMVQLFLLIVDRDGKENRWQQLERLEGLAREELAGQALFFADNASKGLGVEGGPVRTGPQRALLPALRSGARVGAGRTSGSRASREGGGFAVRTCSEALRRCRRARRCHSRPSRGALDVSVRDTSAVGLGGI